MIASSVKKTPSHSFRERVLRAGIWSFGLQFAGRLLGLVRTVVLARLLSPNDIGLFAIAAMALNLLETFSRTGFRSALIHKPGLSRSDLDTAWTVHIIRGVLRAMLLWMAAPYIADLYEAPLAVSLIRMIALLLLFHGAINTGTVYFRKELEYNKQFLIEFGGLAADLTAVAVTALIVKNAWALAVGLMARYLTHLILSYTLHPFRPRLYLTRKALKPLMHFGIWMSLSGIVIFIGRQAAGAVLGKVISIQALGFYQMAFLITQAVILDVMRAITSVAFPALSKLQKESSRFRHASLTVIGLSAAIMLPLSVMIVLTAEEFTQILLGANWLPMIPVLKVLALACLTISMATAGNPVFLGGGYPRNMFKVQLSRAVCVLLTVYPLTQYGGATGAALSMLAGGLCMLTVAYFQIRRMIVLQIEELAGLILPPLLACGMAVLSWEILGIIDFKTLAGSGIELGVKLTVGLAVYIIIFQISQRINTTGVELKLWKKKDLKILQLI